MGYETKTKAPPPVVKTPRPLLTMGDIWNAVFAFGAFILQKLSGKLVSIVRIPYDFINTVIKTLNKVPLAGKALSLPFQPIKLIFGAVLKVVSKIAGFFKIIFIILLAILLIKLVLKLVSRIIYLRNKRKYKKYYKDLEQRLDTTEESSSTQSSIIDTLKGMSFY